MQIVVEQRENYLRSLITYVLWENVRSTVTDAIIYFQAKFIV